MGPDFTPQLQPSDFFNQIMMNMFLESVPMLMPFKDNEDGHGLRHVVQAVATYLSRALHDV